MSKAIVLHTTQGRYAGLWTITGRITDEEAGKVESFFPEVKFRDGHVSGASLIKAMPRYLLYREYRPEMTGLKPQHEGDKPQMSPGQR